MNLEIDGVVYTNFTSATCDLRLDALSNSFSFEAVAPIGALPFKGGEACRVFIDDEPILTGFIEVISVSYAAEEHRISIRGRDKPADLLDSTINKIDDLSGEGLSLKSLIEKVIAELDIDLQVVDEVSPPLFNAAEDIVAPEPGENAFSFIEKYARKRQVLLTSNGNGNIVITSNSGIEAVGAVQHQFGATDNNIISSEFSFDTTGRYNAYQVASGLNPVALQSAGDTDLSSVVNQGNGVFDPEIRTGRALTLISEVPFSDAQCKTRAEWEANIRRARGLLYSAIVSGYRVGGSTSALWQLNRIYQIVDDFVGKVEPMLCNAIQFSLSADAGSQTSLGFVGQNAYTQFITPGPLVSEAANLSPETERLLVSLGL